MRKRVAGSKMLRGRKKRMNIRKQVTRKPVIEAQTMRRRILLTGGSGLLSRMAPAGRAAERATPLATVAVGVEDAFATPSLTRAAGGVPEGTSLSSGASVAPPEAFWLGVLSTPQTSICQTGRQSDPLAFCAR